MPERARAATTIAGTIAATASAYGAAVGPPVAAIVFGAISLIGVFVVVVAAMGRGPFSEQAEAAATGKRLRPKLEELSQDGRSLFELPEDDLRDGRDYRRDVENWVARVARTFTDAGMPTEAARFDTRRIPNDARGARSHLTPRHEVLTDFIADLREQEGLPREGDY